MFFAQFSSHQFLHSGYPDSGHSVSEIAHEDHHRDSCGDSCHGGGDSCHTDRMSRKEKIFFGLVALLCLLGWILSWAHPAISTMSDSSDLDVGNSPQFWGWLGILASFVSHFWFFVKETYFGMLLGIFFSIGIHFISSEWIDKALGKDKALAQRMLRALVAGLLFDVCSHGILLIAQRLYKKGMSLSQTLVFLIVSPWNSFSFLFIMASLLSWQIALLFLLGSMLIALITGLITEILQKKTAWFASVHSFGSSSSAVSASSAASALSWKLETSPHAEEAETHGAETHRAQTWEAETHRAQTWREKWREARPSLFSDIRMVLKWTFVGFLLGTLIEIFVPSDFLHRHFGASLMGLLWTLLVATVLEVCSEGNIPVVYQLVHKAQALGNGFLFLMAGVTTDATEWMILRNMTNTHRVPLTLAVLNLIQILPLSYFLNMGWFPL